MLRHRMMQRDCEKRSPDVAPALPDDDNSVILPTQAISPCA
ncbi:MAG: hypothetical protein WBO29_13845 [Albidovulum sp.]